MRVWTPDPDAGYIARDVRRGQRWQSQHVVATARGFRWKNHPEGERMSPIPRDRWDDALAFAGGS